MGAYPLQTVGSRPRIALSGRRFVPNHRGHLWAVEQEEQVSRSLATLLWSFAIALALFLLLAYVALRWGPGAVRYHQG